MCEQVDVRIRVRVKDAKAWEQLIRATTIKLCYADFINRVVEFDFRPEVSEPIREVNERTLREGLRKGYFVVVNGW